MNDKVVTGEVLPPVGSSAVAEYNATESGLAALREQFANVPDVTNSEGMKQAKVARRTCVALRTDLEAKRKELKAPLLEAGRTLDSEAERIRDEILKVEQPFDDAIKAEEAKAEAEREKKRQADAAAKLAIEAELSAIRNMPVAYVTADAAVLRERIAELQANTLEHFDDVYLPTAQQAKDTALEALDRLLTVRVEADEAAERNRAEAERLENERLAQEQRERVAEAARQRTAEIDSFIGEIRDEPRQCVGLPAAHIRTRIETLAGQVLTPALCDDRVDEAAQVRAMALVEMERIFTAAEEAERVAAAQAAQQRQLDEQAAKQRQEAEEAEQARKSQAEQEEANRRAAARAESEKRAEEQRQRWASRQVQPGAYMTDDELDALCSLLMAADPSPIDEEQRLILVDWVDAESRRHGFTDWIDALHGLAPSARKAA